MKKIFKKSYLLIATCVVLSSCKKFDEINKNPLAASADQVQVEYFIDNSIIGAQQEPGLAERMFILYWVPGGHTMQDEDGETFSEGGYDDGWTSEYYRQASSWLNAANSAIDVGNQQIAAGTSKVYTKNLIQVARIWRAYLMSELSDTFGPIPVDGFQGVNPEFKDVKTVYYFLLDELKDASAKLDVSVVNPTNLAKQDPAFGYNYAKWRKYANSMRMRLAMRLSEIDPAKAKAEFEAAAATNDFISAADQTFQVAETANSYDALSSVYRKDFSWMSLPISATLNNLSVGLGGVKTADQLPAFSAYVKPADWMGQRFTEQFSSKTNDPSAGYWFNGLPYTIDPRMYKIFTVPGDITNSLYPNLGSDFIASTKDLKNASGAVVKTIDAKYTWNAKTDGDWGAKGAMNQVINTPGCKPILNLKFRAGTNKRVFFGPWETYFLLAEGAERGWASPVAAQTAYETGIAKSFEYMNVTVGSYLTSTDYNRVGTSVSWSHTTEPGATRTMNYEDGITGATGTVNIAYPKNDLYKSGAIRNDHMTKILTQKFIAQTPWLPIETWNDHRRLGLPFYENPVFENPMPGLPDLNSATYLTSSVKFFSQRVKYPSSLKNSNIKGYNQAVTALAGADAVLTPLWWAKKP
ncbi:SusD/RagB family nutrient-binding outer membrane lipoprotein [Pedobacter sp. LMG 31464]|uniref:SusD/RagB family nutrient-binding outer membrane lipoprotein n=1 Tax=Pedobacter planticolens TaxID=2679964 RepID=A0A923DZ45_9SPHI|nr:SusD/RagB family nutrient-binding outer membrane lipoprotein [Pedobacter planticolens]MBB2145113.1 SusD/RagB family nutrient-binding outer membrane lipoprotein [Pedobacter planticolens]